MKTFSAKPQEVERKWYVIDAADKVLGRVAVEAANILRGKNKTIFTPHVDCGDFVIIVNADKVVLTGNKENAKIYTRFSGYVGGKQVDTPRKIRARRPELLLELAVKGMVPHTRLGRQQMTKLKVYAGANHPHEAQQPTAIAHAWLTEGSGRITINRRGFEEYLPTVQLQNAVLQPFQVTNTMNKFDVNVVTKGGGIHGQVGAIRMAIARALVQVDEASRSQLREFGLLTRDSRMKERKKPGRPGARKRYQFSKR